MIRLTAMAAAVLTANLALAANVEESREWTETFQVSAKPRLLINNIWGDVTVTPGQPGEIVVQISEFRSAPNQGKFDRSLEVIPLNIQAEANNVEMVVGRRDGIWHDRDYCQGCRVDYQFAVRVPPGTALDVRTVNDGTVRVSGINGPINAGNVNGPVTVNDATNCEQIESVNGAILVAFTEAPSHDCGIETINGDIQLLVPEGAGLDVAMDLSNGRMLSDLPIDPFALPARVEETRTGGRYQYRVTQPAGVRLAGGGPVFNISSMNGDIRISNK